MTSCLSQLLKSLVGLDTPPGFRLATSESYFPSQMLKISPKSIESCKKKVSIRKKKKQQLLQGVLSRPFKKMKSGSQSFKHLQIGLMMEVFVQTKACESKEKQSWAAHVRKVI